MSEKEILLSDLLARIPYNVKVSINGGRPITLTLGDLDAESNNTAPDESIRIKSYLRPMSSITEKEKQERYKFSAFNNIEVFDWYNAHHFDYRGLIEMGLALEAPEGMYVAKSVIPKDPNILGIKDEFDKDEVMGVLGAVYDIWKAKETKDVRNGCGRSGVDGMMTVDVWRLFNQMLTVLHYNSRAPKHGESVTDTD